MRSGKFRRSAKAIRIEWTAWALTTLALAAGCVTDRPDPRRPDPLTGLPKQIPPADRAISSTFDPKRNEAAAVTASANTNPGSMNGGVSNLSIGGTSPSSPSSTSSTAASAWSGTESKTVPPTSTIGTRPGLTPAEPVSVMVGGGPRIRTFEEAQQFLAARGVKWQDLQTTGEGEWKFSCSIPNKNNPNSVRTYEARDRYGLHAIQKVIDQISRDQQ
ncbi:MAG: hypothetical protein N2039_01225 [Gemmataceae bacterium]|nr:hypothetical protein [Gemmataceae bacterium]